jgi:hypothetical protein
MKCLSHGRRVPADAVDTPAGWNLPKARGWKPVQWTRCSHIRVAVAIKQANAHADLAKRFAMLHLAEMHGKKPKAKVHTALKKKTMM